MSYRVGTPNYGLPQTEGTDKRDWSDTNQPFLLIDTAIKGAVDTSASASAAAATAQQTADGANTAAAHAQTDATTAQTLATSASELATTAKNRADAAYTLADTAESVYEYDGSQPSTEVINCGAEQTRTFTVTTDSWFQANFNLGGSGTNGIVWANNIVVTGFQHISGTAYHSFFAKAGTVIKAATLGNTTIQVYRQ